MLNSTKIEIFKHLNQPRAILELSNLLELNHSTVSKAVDSLSTAGLVVKEKRGQHVCVSRSESLHAQTLKDILIEYPRLPLSNILTTTSAHIMSVLKSQYSIMEVAELTGMNRKTVSSTIHELAKYGIVLHKENKYFFSERHPLIRNYVDNYWKYKTNKIIRQISDDAILIWQRGPEFLFKTDSEYENKNKVAKKKSIQPTAFNVFQKYDLKVMGDTRYYFYSDRELKDEEYIIHTILIDSHSPIYNSYALALYSKTCPSELIKFGRYYAIEKHIETLLEYIATKKKNSTFVLPWGEYQDLVKDLQ
jgi:predicted transcriptional regulator